MATMATMVMKSSALVETISKLRAKQTDRQVSNSSSNYPPKTIEEGVSTRRAAQLLEASLVTIVAENTAGFTIA